MQVRFGSRRKIQFTDKTHPVTGIFSVIIGVLALAGLVALCLVSSSRKGNSGFLSGVLGLLVLAAGIVGFIMAAKCYKRDEIYMVTGCWDSAECHDHSVLYPDLCYRRDLRLVMRLEIVMFL